MEIAKRLRPFGVKILATKRNWSSYTVSCGKLQDHSLMSELLDVVLSSSLKILLLQILMGWLTRKVVQKICTNSLEKLT